MGKLYTTLYWIFAVALFGIPILALVRGVTFRQFSEVYVIVILGFCMLSFLGKYYTVLAEFEAYKKQHESSKGED
jgi:hypothetical protein